MVIFVSVNTIFYHIEYLYLNTSYALLIYYKSFNKTKVVNCVYLFVSAPTTSQIPTNSPTIDSLPTDVLFDPPRSDLGK